MKLMLLEMVIVSMSVAAFLPCLEYEFRNLVLFDIFYPGDVLVILDLRVDESLFEAGLAREVNMKFSH
jgi:hypothetical protein